jgi:hypothetical protein
MRETASHLFADIARMKHAMSTADVHLIHLAVGWFNGHREKGSEPLTVPELYEKAVDAVQVTDDDHEIAAALLTTFSAMPD